MLTRLDIHNFKAFQDQALELRPITLIIGPNNSGKSSLLAPLRLLNQTLLSFDIGVPLLLNGPLGDFGSYRDLVHGNHRGRPMGMTLTMRPTAGDRRRARLGGRQRPPKDDSRTGLWRARADDVTIDLSFKYRLQRRELLLRHVALSAGARHLLSLEASRDSERHMVTRVAGQELSPEVRQALQSAVRLNHFLPRVSPMLSHRATSVASGASQGALFTDAQVRDLDTVLREAYDAALYVNSALEQVEYLGPMRSPAQRAYHHTGETHSRIGATGENWASALAIESGSRVSHKPIRQAVTEWLTAAGLASDIDIQWASDSHYEVRLKHPLSGEYENIADVGQGNSQVLPVLVAGLRLGSGYAYVVEEPEIHLHPKAQAELGSFFKSLYDSGVQCLVETHSEYMLLRLQQHVASGAIPANDIAVYYVHASESGKEVIPVALDDEARFADVIPGGFFPEGLKEAKALARIRAAAEITGAQDNANRD